MKKVLLVSLSIRFGGGETYLEQLTPILRDRVKLIVFCIHPEVKTRMQALGIETLCVSLAGKWTEVFRIPIGVIGLLYLRVFRGVQRIILNGYAPAALTIPATLLGYRTYLIAHLNLTSRKTLAQRLFTHRRYLLNAKFASKIICVSEPVASELRSIFPSKDIRAIPNWITQIPLPRGATHKSDGTLNILFVGRLVELKGLPLLLAALKQVHGVRLTVVGEGAFRKKFEKLSEGLDVRFVGFQRETGSFFQDADLVVNPSHGPEGLPMVSLEAMANSLPCILSDLPVHVEISQDGIAALLFRSGSVDDLVEKLSQMIASEDLRRSYGEKARRAIAEFYSAPLATFRYLEALEVD